MQDRHFLIEGCQRFGLGMELLQSHLQDAQIIVIAAHQRTIAIRTYGTAGKLCARGAGGKTTFATLKAASNALPDSVLRYFQPDHQIQCGA
jgi:hypothetical protein